MENKPLTIIAKVVVKDDSVDFVKGEMSKVVEATRKEEGCINYDLHQDNESPHIFIFYENWSTKALWKSHMESAHLAQFLKATEDAVEKVVINEMSMIS